MRNITSPSTGVMTHSLWRSPVPYLMGGMGAMLVLIVFALLLLFFSHWNKKRTAQESQSRDEHGESLKTEMGNRCTEGNDDCKMEKRIVVIMAGHENPTFIAKPTSVADPQI
ncbi:hypothetical protein SUGI_0895380 [Cryptomeria japonica]|nr:hypothetical protein SUGI_0895380 [Cryptomeria japonica]